MKQITITENARGYDYPSATLASHIFSLTSGTYTNTAGGTSITVPAPSIKVKYNTSANGRNGIDDAISITPSVSDRIYAGRTGYTATMARLNANTDKALTSNGDASYTFPLSEYFTASNPTVKSIPINWVINSGWLTTGVFDSQGLTTVGYRENFTGTITSEGAIVLNAPPTFTASTVSGGPYYQNAIQYTVNVSSLSAQYGGTISEVKLTIGSQSVTRSDNGTLVITPQNVGTYTPTITVTDSRGQVTTKTLDSITVLANTVGISNLSAQRINANDLLDDEGTNAIVTFDASYAVFTGNYLQEPTVTVDGTSTSNITWYENWDNTNGFSNAINWTSYAPTSPKTIYGKVADTFTDSLSYQIGVTVSTTYAQSSTITTTLAQAFYLLVGKAGGKGLGIGMKPTTDALHIGMPQINHDDVSINGDETVNGKVSVNGGGVNAVELQNDSDDVMYSAKRTDTNTEVRLGVGIGGTNHGVFSAPLNDWMVFSDGNYSYLSKGALGRTAEIGSGTASSDHGVALKNFFDANKSTVRRNDLIAFYDSTSGNGSVDFGYFLNGYDNNPYGGFFSAHYDTPYYIGIYNGTYTQKKLLTVTTGAQNLITITTASVTFSSIASGANNHTTKALSLSGWYPIGVVGWYATGTNQSNVGLYRCYMTGRTIGSATLNVYVSNHGSSAMTPTISAEILWIRAS